MKERKKTPKKTRRLSAILIRKHRCRQSAVATDTHASYPPPPLHPATYLSANPRTCHHHSSTYHTATVQSWFLWRWRRWYTFVVFRPLQTSRVYVGILWLTPFVRVPVFLSSLYIIIIIDVCMCNSGGRATGLNRVIYNNIYFTIIFCR